MYYITVKGRGHTYRYKTHGAFLQALCSYWKRGFFVVAFKRKPDGENTIIDRLC